MANEEGTFIWKKEKMSINDQNRLSSNRSRQKFQILKDKSISQKPAKKIVKDIKDESKRQIPKISKIFLLAKNIFISILKFRINNKFRPLKLAKAEHLLLINDLASAKREKQKKNLDYKLSTFKYRKKILKIKNFIRKCRLFICFRNQLSKKNFY